MFDRKGKRPMRHYSSSSAILLAILAASPTALAAPTQPAKSGTPGTFEIVGNSLVSAQQLFLGTPNRVYILDKVENNPTKVNGHPAWGSEYDVNSNNARAMDVVTNSFCAGGSVLGNGTWVNVGGNQAVTFGGITADKQDGTLDPYHDADGGKSIRLLNACDDSTCNWSEAPPLTTRRWYPTLETLEDGSLIIIGGNQFGGFVNSKGNNNPTYEYFPSKGDPIGYPLLESTLPANLYPLTWLLPSGNLFVQLNWASAILDYKTNTQYDLDNIPDAVRTYPASAGTVMLPLTPANNWTATVLFCGGSDIESDQWDQGWNIAQHPTSSSCVKISPDYSRSYVPEEPMPEGRSMVSLIMLPDGKVFAANGANTGTAGYGNVSWSVGQSFADHPVLAPLMYDPEAPAGSRWSRDGLSPSTVPRMYHSSATLLPDGSVFISGSNPNADWTTDVKYPTDYRVERFYPLYYDKRRPEPEGLPTKLSYGGAPFNVTLSKDDLGGDVNNISKAKVVVIRTGFSTHAMNMGQRFVQLDSSYTGNEDGSAVLSVSQLPPNPAVIAPGPALIFVVVDGVPSVGQAVMVGSGQLGKQQVTAVGALPDASLPPAGSGGSNTPSKDTVQNGGAVSIRIPSWTVSIVLLLLIHCLR